MGVSVMLIREMSVRMPDRLMPMSMRVPHGGCLVRAMVVMVLVVFVLVFMLECLVQMRMLMPLAEVQPYAHGHQSGSGPKQR